jgi:hypothetical protein
MALETTAHKTATSAAIRTNNYKRAHTLDLLRIRRTRIMRIYLLRRHALVEADKPMEEVVTMGFIMRKDEKKEMNPRLMS